MVLVKRRFIARYEDFQTPPSTRVQLLCDGFAFAP
jgi:hypothetical protein